MKPELFSVWEGVYSGFAEAGGDLDAFESDLWIEKQRDRVMAEFRLMEQGSALTRDYPLPLVLAMTLAHGQTVSVLDFGGGMGVQYLECVSRVPGLDITSDSDLVYFVVDSPALLQKRPETLNRFKNLHFLTELTAAPAPVDIIHIGSTLQYIEDWQALLVELVSRFSPRYVVFSDLFVGDVPTFVSHQIFYTKRIPHLFINRVEFMTFMRERLHMTLIYQAKFVRAILNQEAVFPNFGLPKSHRIDRPYHFIFKRA